MIEHTLLIFWGIWLLLILVAACRVLLFLFLRRQQDKLWGDGRRNQQSVAVIVAAKGFDLQATPRFFDSIFAQNYSNYRVIVCFESWNDPVALWLSEHLEAGPRNPVWTHPDQDHSLRSITLICSGPAEFEGQKVHNQIAAFKDLTGSDAIIAFADADIVCGSDWLPKLVAPINQGTHPLSTTYRWLIPKRPTLPNQLASVINGSITTQGGSELTNVLWGGSMALSRKVFDDLDVPSLLAGSLNDDLRLSKAARQQGNKVAFVRSLILPTLIDFNWRSFFEFVKRQYTQVKFFSPILYTGTNIVLGFYALGALTIVSALIYGYFYAWIPVAAAYVIDQFRSLARQQVYLSLFPENGIRQKLFAASWLEHMMTPFWMLLHWALLISTWTQNRITWAGIRYQIISNSETKVLFRPSATQTLPAGVPGPAMLAALLDRKRPQATQPVRPIAVETPVAVTFTADPATAIEVNPTGVAPAHFPEEVSTFPQEEIATPTDFSPEGSAAAAVSHPGAPSATLPLTTAFYERTRPFNEQPTARERGRLSAAEVVLSKSRVLTPVLFRGPAREPSSERKKEKTSSLAPLRLPVVPVLSIAELTLTKTRLEGGVRPLAPAERPRPSGSSQSTPEWLRIKTRIRTTTLHQVSTGTLSTPAVADRTPLALKASPESTKVRNTVHQTADELVFTWPASRSYAARRPNIGGGNLNGIDSTYPALSSRVSQSSRIAGGSHSPRPGNRRASGRR